MDGIVEIVIVVLLLRLVLLMLLVVVVTSRVHSLEQLPGGGGVIRHLAFHTGWGTVLYQQRRNNINCNERVLMVIPQKFQAQRLSYITISSAL